MRFPHPIILAVFAAALALAAPNAHADPQAGLSAAIKQHLTAAKTVLDRPVTEASFTNGKPTLVIFFASW